VAATSSSVILPLAANRPSESQIPQRYLPPGLGRDLGDAGTHQTRADDSESTRHVPLLRGVFVVEVRTSA
jgi:hypothetical protein